MFYFSPNSGILKKILGVAHEPAAGQDLLLLVRLEETVPPLLLY